MTDRKSHDNQLTLELEALEERVAPGLLLGVAAGVSASASVGVCYSPPPCNPCYTPPPCNPCYPRCW